MDFIQGQPLLAVAALAAVVPAGAVYFKYVVPNTGSSTTSTSLMLASAVVAIASCYAVAQFGGAGKPVALLAGAAIGALGTDPLLSMFSM